MSVEEMRRQPSKSYGIFSTSVTDLADKSMDEHQFLQKIRRSGKTVIDGLLAAMLQSIFFREQHGNAKENVPTQQQTSCQDAWFSCAHEDERRPSRLESATRQGTRTRFG